MKVDRPNGLISFSLSILGFPIAVLLTSFGSLSATNEPDIKVKDRRDVEYVDQNKSRSDTLDTVKTNTFLSLLSIHQSGEDKSQLILAASTCLAGSSLSASTPTFNRSTTSSLGSGLASPCSLSSTGTAAHFKTYQFNLTGCTTFPTQVTISVCPGSVGGSGACAAPAANTDTVIYLYRSGGSLTTGTGSIAPFNPANPCTNAVAANDDLTGPAVATGGSSCDGATCHPACTGNTSTSGMFRTLGPGFFNVVVAGFSNTTVGNYNLFVNAPGAGCSLVNTPTAANGVVSGQVVDSDGAPLAGVVVSLNGTQNRKTITDVNGSYHWGSVETNGFYTVTPSRSNYVFSPAQRTLSQLGNNTDAPFTGVPTGTLNNPMETAEYFVRQHYRDFLAREPDEDGFNYWSGEILNCGNDSNCIGSKAIDVSAAFFFSIEFQQKSAFVDRLYRLSFERPPLFVDFISDVQSMSSVVVNQDDWQQRLAASKSSFVDSWVQRVEFRSVYDNLSQTAFVNKLISNSGMSVSDVERNRLISGLLAGNLTRAQALKEIVENDNFVAAKFNEQFVLMEYFGYLKRDPDEMGYKFWLEKLNKFNGDWRRADMIKAFLSSDEYKDRFPR